jgi:hypothetical protein
MRFSISNHMFFWLVTLGLGLAPTASNAGYKDKMNAATQTSPCNVRFNLTQQCSGTIARGAPGYDIFYDPATGNWTASGMDCVTNSNKTSADSGGDPLRGYFSVFHAPYSFDDNSGAVTDTAGNVVGQLRC